MVWSRYFNNVLGRMVPDHLIDLYKEAANKSAESAMRSLSSPQSLAEMAGTFPANAIDAALNVIPRPSDWV